MNSFLKNIGKTFSSNVIQLISGILTGFLVPDMLGIIGYADYKTYTLYLAYISILSFGMGDGLLIKYAGTDKEQLDAGVIRYYTRLYYIQLLVFFSVGLIICFLVVPSENRFISIALAFSILSSQTIGLHQNFSILTSRFGEYSKRVIIKSIVNILVTLTLFTVSKITDRNIRFELYLVFVLISEFCLALWYFITYKEFNIGRIKKTGLEDNYFKVLKLGLMLLFSNMSGTILLNLDRQFVSVLFPKETYGVYAFAYNMFSLVTTMTAAISVVLFPTMKKIQNYDIRIHLQKYHLFFTILVVSSLMVFFPLSIVIEWLLKSYITSISILRIILPGLVLSSCVNVIFYNFYKYENKVSSFFVKTVLCIILSATMNYVAYEATKSFYAISWASIVSLSVWYFLIGGYFIKKYKVRMEKTIIYTFMMFLEFYIITSIIKNNYLGLIVYLICLVASTTLTFPKLVKQFVLSAEKHLTHRKS